MSDETKNDEAADGGAQADATNNEAKEIETAVEKIVAERSSAAVAPAPLNDAEKTEKATAIYTAWRNAQLRGLATVAFQRVETASPHLIAAIAAAI